jgi:multidrug resistance efflux pump
VSNVYILATKEGPVHLSIPGRLVVAALAVTAVGTAPSSSARGADRTASDHQRIPLRLHGTVEPVHSVPIAAPRLTGQGAGSLVIVHLATAGSRVRAGDLLVEFDRAAQAKVAQDREAEYRDVVAQIERKRGDQESARGHAAMDLADAEAALRDADLDVQGNELATPIAAEKNDEALEEARARLDQLRKTNALKQRADEADLRLLEIQRDRAANAWRHARQNVARMRVTSPIDGLVVLKVTWQGGTMGEVQEGQEVRPGLPLLDVVDVSAMRVRVRASQADVARLRVDQAARVTLTSYPSRTFTSRLEQISPLGSTTFLSNRVRTFGAVFSIDGVDPHLLPDLAAAVDVLPAEPRR